MHLHANVLWVVLFCFSLFLFWFSFKEVRSFGGASTSGRVNYSPRVGNTFLCPRKAARVGLGTDVPFSGSWL